jgi:hypothetical protein
VDSVSDVSAGAGRVWAYANPGSGLDASVVSIDPETAAIDERIPVRGFFGEVEADPANGVWVLTSVTETERDLVRIDPASGRHLGEPLRLEGGVMETASGLGKLWLVDSSQGTLRRIEVDAHG